MQRRRAVQQLCDGCLLHPGADKFWAKPSSLFVHAYPVGYRATKTAFSTTYTMTIVDHESGQPLFRVTDDTSGEVFEGSSATAPWDAVRLSKNSTRRISGPNYFGFSDPETQSALCTLYDADELARALAGKEVPVAPAGGAGAQVNMLDFAPAGRGGQVSGAKRPRKAPEQVAFSAPPPAPAPAPAPPPAPAPAPPPAPAQPAMPAPPPPATVEAWLQSQKERMEAAQSALAAAARERAALPGLDARAAQAEAELGARDAAARGPFASPAADARKEAARAAAAAAGSAARAATARAEAAAAAAAAAARSAAAAAATASAAEAAAATAEGAAQAAETAAAEAAAALRRDALEARAAAARGCDAARAARDEGRARAVAAVQAEAEALRAAGFPQ